ncbi:MAG: hypothetical protein LBT08_00985 [Synergistaceae bacterium]|jgi:hypothetical protein|nr:hypothetical protein [Synergistaceae bacterium]
MIIELKKFTITIEGTAEAGQFPFETSGCILSAASAESDGEVVAAITAAISEASGAEVQVVSFAPSPETASQVPVQAGASVRTQPKSTAWRTVGWLQNSEGFEEYFCQ